MPSSPVATLGTELPKAKVAYESGDDIPKAVELARRSDVAIVFVNQWAGEGLDAKLELGGNQNALVSAIAEANPKTIVVVESGGAILMPWIDRVPAVLEAFYPGIRGGQAIARIMTGKVNPSGHLPITFPASIDQLSFRRIPGEGLAFGTPATASYTEGAAIGYKWYDLKGIKPLFAFGHGLSYTQFSVADLSYHLDKRNLTVSFSIANIGKREGKAVGQVYIAPADYTAADWESPKRLGAFAKVDLLPGARRSVEVSIDPRLLATYQTATSTWKIRAGTYHIQVGQSSDNLPLVVDALLPEIEWSSVH
jgi:beta-glucosidase